MQVLYLSSTQISDISALGGLKKLQYLDLRNTPITDLEPLLPLLGKLDIKTKWSDSDIIIGHNPLQFPPMEIAALGNAAVLRWFKEHKNADRYLNEAKVLLIGKTGAGKTSLRYKLRDPDAAMPAEKESTHGVDVETVSFTDEKEREFKMHLWDFEGQQISLQTHQFFLSARALYIFVADQRTEKADIDDWLKTVSLLSDRSPVLLFHNEKKGRICTLSQDAYHNFGDFLHKQEHRADLQAVARDVPGTPEEDCCHQPVQAAAFTAFSVFLQQQVADMDIIKVPVNDYYFAVREEVGALAKTEDTITWTELKKICRRHGIKERQRLTDLTRLFHDLGIYLHYFNPEEDTQLGNLVILRREWATEAVYDVLKSEYIRKDKGGVFTESDLRQVWLDNPDYADRVGALRQLMEKFRLCYRIGSTSKHIAPQLLPAEPPQTYQPAAGEPLLLRFEYDFMPKGILTKLTVEMHRYIAAGQRLVWRDGFVAEQYGARAEVIEAYGDRQIRIKVTGEKRHKLLNEIAYEVQKLNKEYYFNDKLQVYTMLPCTCEECRRTDEPAFHRLQSVLKRLHKGKTDISCPHGEDAEVREVLRILFRNENLEEIRRSYRHEENILEAVYQLVWKGLENQGNILKGQKDIRTDLDRVDKKITRYTQFILDDLEQISGRLFDSQQEQQAFLEKVEDTLTEAEKQRENWYKQDTKKKLKLSVDLLFLKYEEELSLDGITVPKTWREFRDWFIRME